MVLKRKEDVIFLATRSGGSKQILNPTLGSRALAILPDSSKVFGDQVSTTQPSHSDSSSKMKSIRASRISKTAFSSFFRSCKVRRSNFSEPYLKSILPIANSDGGSVGSISASLNICGNAFRSSSDKIVWEKGRPTWIFPPRMRLE